MGDFRDLATIIVLLILFWATVAFGAGWLVSQWLF